MNTCLRAPQSHSMIGWFTYSLQLNSIASGRSDTAYKSKGGSLLVAGFFAADLLQRLATSVFRLRSKSLGSRNIGLRLISKV